MKLNFRKNLLLKKNLEEMKIKEELDAGIIIHRIQGILKMSYSFD